MSRAVAVLVRWDKIHDAGSRPAKRVPSYGVVAANCPRDAGLVLRGLLFLLCNNTQHIGLSDNG